MALIKKPKKGPDKTGGFDATPPRGENKLLGNGHKLDPGTPSPLDQGKKGVQKFLTQYKAFLIASFRSAPRLQQESWIHRFSQICCIGLACVVLNCFYSVLLPVIRIIALPTVVGLAWFFANKVVSPAIITRLGDNMNNF